MHFPNHGQQDALCLFNGFRIFRYSYEQIYELTLRCAAYFHQQGIQKGDRVLIWVPNRTEWGVISCACAISGIVLVPLDARNTPEFAVRVGMETQAKMIIRTRHRRDPGLPIPTLFVEDLFILLQTIEPLTEFPLVQPNDILEIIYTSGTTGNPKGVVLTQGNVSANLNDILKIIPIDSSYRLLSVLPLSHALEQMAGFWTPLAAGASVVHIQQLKPSALFEVFQRIPIHAMVLVPRLLALLKGRIETALEDQHLSGYLDLGLRMADVLSPKLRRIYFYPIHQRFNSRFQLLVSGGSSLPADVEVFWKRLGFELLQGYGLTECSPVLSVTRIGNTRLGSVGHPLESVNIRLNEHQEILAQGPNIFYGYYLNREATREVFEDGWFKTGDVGEMDRDGFLTIRSRIKDVIVTPDGINIYPEDIESILETHPAVQEACVIGVGEHEERVHAVLLLKNSGEAEKVIQETNAQLIPEQRIETWSLWPESEFPKTTTLKIKKNEVREKVSGNEQPLVLHPMEEGSTFQQILIELTGLSLEQCQPRATLGHDLGLSSIERVELVSRLEEEFRLDIGDQAISADTTLAELEQAVEQQSAVDDSPLFRRWTLSLPCRAVRWMFDHCFLRFLLKAVCDTRCLGLENLRDLQGPCLIVANHTSHVDTPLLRSLVPAQVGDRICPAAWKEYFDREGKPLTVRFGKWAAWQLATTLFNIFPFPQNTAYRRSMAYAGELVDRGWSILFFPEGGRTRDGKWQEFREGVGILAQNLQIPIVPVAIKGGEKILPAGSPLPRRGKVSIAFGKPFHVPRLPYKEISERVENEILVLWNQLENLL